MLLDLPLSLEVDGIERAINPDFRDIITLLIACNDSELNLQEKAVIILNNLYVDDFTEFENVNEAYKKACWFIDWGKDYSNQPKDSPRIIDWEKDYNCIISAVNKSANVVDIREIPFLHWWTFLGYFAERGECQFSMITEIRNKLSKGKKLEKYEKEFLRDNRDMVIIKDNSDKEFELEMFGGV